jgi:hypothetical protein
MVLFGAAKGAVDRARGDDFPVNQFDPLALKESEFA